MARPYICKELLEETYEFLVQDNAPRSALSFAEINNLEDKLPEISQKVIALELHEKNYDCALERIKKYQKESLEDKAKEIIKKLIDDEDYETAWNIINKYIKEDNYSKDEDNLREKVLHPYLSQLVNQYKSILEKSASDDLDIAAPGQLREIEKMADNYLPSHRLFHYEKNRILGSEWIVIDDVIKDIQDEFLARKEKR